MIHLESPPLFHCIWSTLNDGITTFSHCIIHVEWWNHHLFPLYIRSTWSDYLFLLYMIHVEWLIHHLSPIVYKIHVKWLPFPILYDPRGICTRSSCWLLTTLWFSCLLQKPTVTLSVLVLSPSLSSLSSSGRSSVSYSSDEVMNADLLTALVKS